MTRRPAKNFELLKKKATAKRGKKKETGEG